MSEVGNINFEYEPGPERSDGWPDGFYIYRRQLVTGQAEAVCWVRHEYEARFIAAVADLHGSLVELLEEVDFEIEQRQHSGNDEYWQGLQAKANRARAAIAEAEGRE